MKKKFGRIGLKRVFLILLTSLSVGYIPYAAVALISDFTTDSNRYVAILLSADAITGYDHWAPPVAFLGSYPSWTLYFNSFGLKTDYIFSATKKSAAQFVLEHAQDNKEFFDTLVENNLLVFKG